jgi:glyoxylase-like metal-dependent hydrolase (beta-lactamase superfamily II)
MVSTPTRRDFLGIVLGGAAGLSLSSPASAQQRSTASTGPGPHAPVASTGPHAPIAAARLSDSLVEFTGAGSNVVVVTGPDGLVMIDGGLRERSADLLKAIAEHTGGKRVQALFNTDWHPERTGSNETLGKAGAKIIAHENTKQYLGAEIFVDWQDRTYKPLPSQALPNQTFYTSGTMTVGTERIEYGHLGQAHTDGALYVLFPASNVLMTGDALSVGKYPIPDYTTGGWLGGLVAANKTLLAMANTDTRLVPGVGPLQTRADLQAQHDMLEAMLDRLKKMMKQGLGPEDIIAAAPTKEFDVKWGNPDLFVSAAYRSMWLHVRELGGIV